MQPTKYSEIMTHFKNLSDAFYQKEESLKNWADTIANQLESSVRNYFGFQNDFVKIKVTNIQEDSFKATLFLTFRYPKGFGKEPTERTEKEFPFVYMKDNSIDFKKQKLQHFQQFLDSIYELLKVDDSFK